jgi:hypothetical protein
MTCRGDASYEKEMARGLRAGKRVVKIANTMWRIREIPHIV